jgi:hypothetical protein
MKVATTRRVEPGEGLQVPDVTWYKHRGLRQLYLMMPILFLGRKIIAHERE